MINLLPIGFQVEASGTSVGGEFLKMPENGKHILFYALGKTVSGYEYWTADNKPVRSKERFTEMPGVRVENGKPDRAKQFVCLVVWDCLGKAVRCLQVSQSGILTAFAEMQAAELDLSVMAIRISATGTGKNKKYTVMPVPTKADMKPTAWQEAYDAIDLELLFNEAPAVSDSAAADLLVGAAEPESDAEGLM